MERGNKGCMFHRFSSSTFLQCKEVQFTHPICLLNLNILLCFKCFLIFHGLQPFQLIPSRCGSSGRWVREQGQRHSALYTHMCTHAHTHTHKAHPILRSYKNSFPSSLSFPLLFCLERYIKHTRGHTRTKARVWDSCPIFQSQINFFFLITKMEEWNWFPQQSTDQKLCC